MQRAFAVDDHQIGARQRPKERGIIGPVVACAAASQHAQPVPFKPCFKQPHPPVAAMMGAVRGVIQDHHIRRGGLCFLDRFGWQRPAP